MLCPIKTVRCNAGSRPARRKRDPIAVRRPRRTLGVPVGDDDAIGGSRRVSRQCPDTKPPPRLGDRHVGNAGAIRRNSRRSLCHLGARDAPFGTVASPYPEPRGVALAPSQFEAAFLSTAHTDADLAATLAAARESLASLGG